MRIGSMFLALALTACASAPPPQVVVVQQPQAVASAPPLEPEPAPPPPASGPRLSDAQIVSRIIRSSRDAYYSTGHPCACPDDSTRAGRSCGNTSAYTKLGGIKCFPQDVTRADIANYRSQSGM